MTLLTGIKCKVEFAGLVCLSGYLPLHQLVSDIQTEVNLHTPIFMGHGTQDQVVAHSWGMKSMQTLKSFGYKPEWHSYQGMGHSSCDEEITDVLKFLMARLA